MLFNAMGSVLDVTGACTFTHAGYVTIDGRTCARLRTDIDVSEIDVPEELEGEYECIAKGKGVSYFDMEGRCLHSVELALVIAFRIETPVPDVEFDGERPTDMPLRVQMGMRGDVFVTLTRNAGKSVLRASTEAEPKPE